jgi:mono/diheme cytochrome c family protein
MRLILLAVAVALAIAWAADAKTAQPEIAKPNTDPQKIERGRYLAIVGGCSDCHTAGYAESEGQVPESQWMRGSPLGFRGPWGTTYATNLRISLSKITEEEWLKYARSLEARPPMPWFNLNKWDEEDLRAFYHYVRQLGPLGKPAPDAVPPHKEPKGPVVTWPNPPAK